ncbi:MAG: aminopeptidase P family protein [Gemmatimonadetes bacterium]|nr:aminopeptidase P family protein [Gemmatimonadota bacterium]NIP83452.1 aminopeptidase P family protein [Gemmatimonadota bacterium]NIR79875.1 aminopeptidase P family protein [Gemmatimonadota bacterium]NIU32415.1 aminopeptidase P family protein [Gemmatimonadota bacterium]NIU36912.1 M24 family metallopeptidase [Gemmatimonadota bacterium]
MARRLGLDRVRSTDAFVPWLEERLSREPAPLYVDEPRRPETTGAPPGMPPLAGSLTLWHRALSETFPGARIESALDVLVELRWRKSPREVAVLRENARATVRALRAAAGRIGPGTTQRRAEAAVVSACLESGAQGPSFWPWTMSGPNATVDRLVRSFFDYEHLDRVMEPGDLVRVDIGCAGGGYGADVGRTLPVSGRFEGAQAEVWDLLVEGYLAGLDAMAPGVSLSEVRAASRARIRGLAPELESDAAREAARLLDDDGSWHAHGVGVESGEEAMAVLREGSVLAYEPMVAVDRDAFYLEDMIAVTGDGHEVLSAGLPYRSGEIARLMEGSRSGGAR